jgi:hypothetical protein
MDEVDLRRQPATRITGRHSQVLNRQEEGFSPSRSVHFGGFLVFIGRRALLAFEELLAVFIKFEGDDLAVGGVDGDLRLLSVDLLLHDLVDVDAPSAAVHRHNFAFTVLVCASQDFHAVALAYGDGADFVLLAEVLRQVGRKELAPQT